MNRAAPLALALAAASITACGPEAPPVAPPPPPPAQTAPPPPPPAPPPKLDALPRADFNRLAVDLDLPLFWIEDKNGSGAIDPDEIAVLWGMSSERSTWIKDGAFTPTFFAAFTSMVHARAILGGGGAAPAGLDAQEQRRRAAVLAELAQGAPDARPHGPARRLGRGSRARRPRAGRRRDHRAHLRQAARRLRPRRRHPLGRPRLPRALLPEPGPLVRGAED